MLEFLVSSRYNIDLMEMADNQNIWQDSYWTSLRKLLGCVTLNSPVEFLEKPSENEVSTK